MKKNLLSFCSILLLIFLVASCTSKSKEEIYFEEMQEKIKFYKPSSNAMGTFSVREDGRPLDKDTILHTSRVYSYRLDPFYCKYETTKGTQIYQQEGDQYFVYILKKDSEEYSKEPSDKSAKDNILETMDHSFLSLPLFRCQDVKHYDEIKKEEEIYVCKIKLRWLMNEEGLTWLNSKYFETSDQKIKEQILDSILEMKIQIQENILNVTRSFTYYEYEDYLTPTEDNIKSYSCENKTTMDLNTFNIKEI